jgi:hypothetical protein
MANYVLLERIELNASAASVTFDNIPQTGYTDLKVVISARTDNAAVNDNVSIRPNGNTTNRTAKRLYGTGASALSDSLTDIVAGNIAGATATASTFGSAEFYLPNYAGSTNKSFSTDGANESNTGSGVFMSMVAGLWSSTAAITSLTLTSEASANFVANSTFSLYGLAAVGTTPAIAPKASGGSVIATDGTYWYHAFLASGTFTPQTGLTCDYLVIAGGGGGGFATLGGAYGAGGGAGGMRSTVTATGGGGSLESAISVTAQAYTITVGAGGAVQSSAGAAGSNGTDSIFSTITSTAGGGGAGGASGQIGKTGGSGGGGAEGGAAGSGTTNQGYAGGANPTGGYAAGGGGAGSIGGSASSQNVSGGSGVATSITGSSVTYAAGGRGGVASAASATANTGNGGEGKAGATGSSGAGGSGIVIIRYLAA